MQRVLELVFRPTADAPGRGAMHPADAGVRKPDIGEWVSALAAHERLANARREQARFTIELHHCDDPPSGDPAWQCLVLDAGARRFAMAVHDFTVLPGVRVRSWEPVALTRDQLPDFAGQCGDVPWRAEIERQWWRLDLDGEPLTVSLDTGVLNAPVSDGIGGGQRAFAELRISLELADVVNPDDAAPDPHAPPDDDTRIELAERAIGLFDLAIALNEDGWLTLVEHDALTDAAQPDEGPRKAGPIEFGTRRTYAAVAAAVVSNIFAQWMSNANGVRAAAGSEYVHQLRIALRRMRTAYRFFGEELSEAALVPEQQELKWIGALLGELRDWDVLVEETFPAVARAAREAALGLAVVPDGDDEGDSHGRADAEALGGATRPETLAAWDIALTQVLGHREQIGATLREAMASPRYAQLLMQVGRQVAVLVARAATRHTRALNPDGRKALRKRYRKIAGAVDLRKLDAEARHQLRIDAKRLRYAIEFLAPALEGSVRRRMSANVMALQDALGVANDAIVGRRFLAQVELPDEVRLFSDGYLIASEVHAVSAGIRQIENIRKKPSRR